MQRRKRAGKKKPPTQKRRPAKRRETKAEREARLRRAAAKRRADEHARGGGFKNDAEYRRWRRTPEAREFAEKLNNRVKGNALRIVHGLRAYVVTGGRLGRRAPGRKNSARRARFYGWLSEQLLEWDLDPGDVYDAIGSPKQSRAA